MVFHGEAERITFEGCTSADIHLGSKTAEKLQKNIEIIKSMSPSPTSTAGATGKSTSKYLSVLYSAIGFDMVSISMSHFSLSLGIISLK